MQQHSTLWHHYLTDFIECKLNLGTQKPLDFVQTELKEFFKALNRMPVREKVVTLHAHHHIYQLHYAKVFSINRGLKTKVCLYFLNFDDFFYFYCWLL